MINETDGGIGMTDPLIDAMTRAVAGLTLQAHEGTVTAARDGAIEVTGLGGLAQLGDRVVVRGQGAVVGGEVIRTSGAVQQIMPEGGIAGLSVGAPVRLMRPPPICPDDSWIGRVIDPDGRPLDGRPLLPGVAARSLVAAPPPPQARRAMGHGSIPDTRFSIRCCRLRADNGSAFLPGRAWAKSTLLAGLARHLVADVVVIGLVGERGRELRHFVEEVMGPEGMARSVVIAATSDRAPQVRRRAALAATAVAEHFRAAGRHVLLIIDSVTRFAEAHREIAVTGAKRRVCGVSRLHTVISGRALRKGRSGVRRRGDITAIYSVLVAGSDMEEPVADWLRGLLDGHVVLDRTIAERGRFPAVDIVRSVSRSLPAVASITENRLISDARRLLGTYDRVETMVRAGLYTSGTDAEVDAAVAAWPALDRFAALTVFRRAEESFAALRQALDTARITPARTEARRNAG